MQKVLEPTDSLSLRNVKQVSGKRKGDAMKRTEQEGNPSEPKASPKKRKTSESETNPGAESSQTHPREENLSRH